jgi:hypothetical protein
VTPDSSPDVSLYLGLATAIATSLGASVSLGLLKPADRDISRFWSAAVLSVAVLGIGAALIAVGKGHSTTLLTRVMFIGLLLPALYALHGALDRILLRRRAVNVTYLALALVAAWLLLMASPSFIQRLVNPHDMDAERRKAFKLADATPRRRSFVCRDDGHNCPGPRYVSFNAYRNNPVAGDERFFVAASHAENTGITGLEKRVELVSNTVFVKPGDNVIIRVYFNNAADFPPLPNGEPDPRSFTRNARVAIASPVKGTAGIAITAMLYADNAKPQVVRDSAAIISSDVVHAEYVRGSATLTNKYFRNGVRLSDQINVVRPDPLLRPGSGALLGYSQLDGRIGGTFAESGWVTARYLIY